MPVSSNTALPGHKDCLHFSIFKRMVGGEIFFLWVQGLRFAHLEPKVFLPCLFFAYSFFFLQMLTELEGKKAFHYTCAYDI